MSGAPDSLRVDGAQRCRWRFGSDDCAEANQHPQINRKLRKQHVFSASDLRANSLHCQIPVKRGPRDAQSFADVEHRHGFVAVHFFGRLKPWVIDQHRLAPVLAPTGTRRRKTSIGPFLNQPPLKLGQRGKNVEDQFTRRRRGVDDPVAERLSFLDLPPSAAIGVKQSFGNLP